MSNIYKKTKQSKTNELSFYKAVDNQRATSNIPNIVEDVVTYSTFTPNLGLEKPDQEDFYDIDVHNKNYDIIDEQMKELSDKAEQALQSGADVKEQVKNAINSKTTVPDVTINDPWSLYIQRIEEIKEGRGNAIQSNVLAGKTFTNDTGVLLTGTMPNRGQASITLNQGSASLPAGYYSGGTINWDEDIKPENIKKGVTIFGVTGTMPFVETSDPNGTNGEILFEKANLTSENIYWIVADNDECVYLAYGQNCNIMKYDTKAERVLWDTTVSNDPPASYMSAIHYLHIDSSKNIYVTYLTGSDSDHIAKITTDGGVVWDTRVDSQYRALSVFDVTSNGDILIPLAQYKIKVISSQGVELKTFEVTTSYSERLEYCKLVGGYLYVTSNKDNTLYITRKFKYSDMTLVTTYEDSTYKILNWSSLVTQNHNLVYSTELGALNCIDFNQGSTSSAPPKKWGVQLPHSDYANGMISDPVNNIYLTCDNKTMQKYNNEGQKVYEISSRYTMFNIYSANGFIYYSFSDGYGITGLGKVKQF